MMLSNTKLSTSISPETLFKVQRIGEKFYLEPNQTLFQAGDNSDYLYVILEGEILIEMGSDPPLWIGSGDIIGETGFILGTKRTKTVKTSALGCTLWRVRRSLIFQKNC
jgi:CRP-like cAMP-binding protein